MLFRSNYADDFDAVVISTPDHHHCHAAVLAMRAGKHVYCQKPLAWSIEETRQLTELARETGAATQMGNQAHATDHLRRTVELVRGGGGGRGRWLGRTRGPAQGCALRRGGAARSGRGRCRRVSCRPW